MNLGPLAIPCPPPLPDYVRCPPDGGTRGLESDLVTMAIFFLFAAVGFGLLARFYRVSATHPAGSLAYLVAGIVYELFPIAGIIVATNFEPKGESLLFEPNFYVAASAFFVVGTVFAVLGVLLEWAGGRRRAGARGA